MMKTKKERPSSKLLNRELFKQMINNGEIRGIKDVENILKDMFGNILQELLEAEIPLQRLCKNNKQGKQDVL